MSPGDLFSFLIPLKTIRVWLALLGNTRGFLRRTLDDGVGERYARALPFFVTAWTLVGLGWVLVVGVPVEQKLPAYFDSLGTQVKRELWQQVQRRDGDVGDLLGAVQEHVGESDPRAIGDYLVKTGHAEIGRGVLLRARHDRAGQVFDRFFPLIMAGFLFLFAWVPHLFVRDGQRGLLDTARVFLYLLGFWIPFRALAAVVHDHVEVATLAAVLGDLAWIPTVAVADGVVLALSGLHIGWAVTGTHRTSALRVLSGFVAWLVVSGVAIFGTGWWIAHG